MKKNNGIELCVNGNIITLSPDAEKRDVSIRIHNGEDTIEITPIMDLEVPLVLVGTKIRSSGEFDQISSIEFPDKSLNDDKYRAFFEDSNYEGPIAYIAMCPDKEESSRDVFLAQRIKKNIFMDFDSANPVHWNSSDSIDEYSVKPLPLAELPDQEDICLLKDEVLTFIVPQSGSELEYSTEIDENGDCYIDFLIPVDFDISGVFNISAKGCDGASISVKYFPYKEFSTQLVLDLWRNNICYSYPIMLTDEQLLKFLCLFKKNIELPSARQ